ncbi:uncharacterized [Tachysurus ichikawai]
MVLGSSEQGSERAWQQRPLPPFLFSLPHMSGSVSVSPHKPLNDSDNKSGKSPKLQRASQSLLVGRVLDFLLADLVKLHPRCFL